MNCCENKNIIKEKELNFCYNCGTIHDYDWIKFDISYNDYNSTISDMWKYKKICYKRIKYLRKKFGFLDNNIILYLDESLEKIKLYNKMKRIPINKYLNSLYKYYCEKSQNIEYKPLINKKVIKLNENIIEIIDVIYNKYPFIVKVVEEYDFDTIYL